MSKTSCACKKTGLYNYKYITREGDYQYFAQYFYDVLPFRLPPRGVCRDEFKRPVYRMYIDAVDNSDLESSKDVTKICGFNQKCN